MPEVNAMMQEIYTKMQDVLQETGFSVVVPQGTEKGALPAVEQSGRIVMDFRGDNKALRMEHYDKKMVLSGANKEGEIVDADFGQLSLSLLDPDTADQRDISYIASEFNETVLEHFGARRKAISTKKMPPPVSKSAAKSGALAYDPNTLASRLATMYPELKEPYRHNVATYGEFLPEDFFVKHAGNAVIQTIRQNQTQRMKKLFGILNEIYVDGTNEVQDVIAVTLLGQMDNDQELLANCVDYMCDDMLAPVIQINRTLASNSGKKLREKMDNPPPYKPKRKKKKGGIMSQLGMPQ